MLEELLEKAEAYGQLNVELLKLKALEKTASAASNAASALTGLILLLMFLCMAGVGIALWLGDLLGKTWYGFFIVAGVYALFGLILLLTKDNWIKRLVSNSLIQHVLN